LQHVSSSNPAKLLFFLLACWCWQRPMLTPDSRSFLPSLCLSRGVQSTPGNAKCITEILVGGKVKFDQLIIRKIIKIVATRCHILRLKCIKFNFGWGSAPDPAGVAHSAPLDHFVVSKNSAACRLTDILQCGPQPQMRLRPLL